MTKTDHRPLGARLLTFQAERMPLLPMLVMAALAIGVIANFARPTLHAYLGATLIFMLYLIQIRTADEQKDFEHDNRYHPDRPVQRGVVTLAELQRINVMAKVGQLLLYASFLDARIMLLGLLSQGYAYLTRHEFFVRDWIRQHFYIYYITHYLQLVILFYALITIIQPVGVSAALLVTYAMLGVVMSEMGRKMFAVEDDTTDDTYSAQLGHRGSAIVLTIIALALTALVWYFIHTHEQHYLYLLLPLGALAWVVYATYHYARHPHRSEAKAVENAANGLMVIAMVAVILGA
jgi:4-hydroxybenzoate polyprenyltransferase